MRRILLPLLSLVLLHCFLHAQVDRQLSARSEVILPNLDFRVQSAGRIGSRTLVVWGSTSADPVTNTGVNVLRMQILDGTRPLGAQRNLGDGVSAPALFAAVVAADNRFLVFFDDRRPDRPGLYMQSVDTGGVDIGEPVLVSQRLLNPGFPPGFVVSGDPRSRFLILWPGTISAPYPIYGRSIDGRGNLLGEEVHVGDDLASVLTLAEFPGARLLHFKRSPSRLLHPDGRLDARPIESARLSLPHHIGPDSSLATLEGGTLRIYANIFDPAPARTVTIPQTVSSPQGTTVVTRNQLGQPQVIYLNMIDSVEGYHFSFERITITATGVSPPERLDERRFQPDTTAGMKSSIVRMLGWTQTRGCNQSYTLRTTLSYIVFLTVGHASRAENVGYVLDENGALRRNDSLVATGCESVPEVPVLRLGKDTVSRVGVLLGGDTIPLEHRRSLATEQRAEQRPNIFERSGKLVTVWAYGFPGSVEPDTAFWRIVVMDGGFGTQPTIDATHMERGIAWPMPGAQLSTTGTSEVIPSSGGDTLYSVRLTTHTAAAAGWNATMGTIVRDAMPVAFRRDHATFDPNRREILAAASLIAGGIVRHHTIFAIDEHGNLLWQIDSIAGVHQGAIALVPAGDLRFIVIAGRNATIYERENAAGSFAFAEQWDDARYQRLLGERFLRWHIEQGRRIAMEIYDLTGEKLESGTIDLHAITGEPYLLEDPADSTLVILHAAEGIRLSLLDHMLRPRIVDRIVSQARSGTLNPAGAFLDDTLNIVWEDHRNHEADIYGTWWHRSMASAVGLEPAMPPAGISVLPNPVHGSAVIRLQSIATGSAELRLVDAIGGCVISRNLVLTPGTSEQTLELGGLPSGVYTLLLRGAFGQVSTRIIVQ